MGQSLPRSSSALGLAKQVNSQTTGGTACDSIRSNLTYANVMATIAVFGVLGGGAFAAAKVSKAPKNSVVSKSIKNGAVKKKDLANAIVTVDKLADGAVTTAKLADGSSRPRSSPTALSRPGSWPMARSRPTSSPTTP